MACLSLVFQQFVRLYDFIFFSLPPLHFNSLPPPQIQILDFLPPPPPWPPRPRPDPPSFHQKPPPPPRANPRAPVPLSLPPYSGSLVDGNDDEDDGDNQEQI